jgi:hypothetical protein
MGLKVILQSDFAPTFRLTAFLSHSATGRFFTVALFLEPLKNNQMALNRKSALFHELLGSPLQRKFP